MIPTKSGMIGFHESLDVLDAQFRSPVIKAKLQHMRDDYFGFRRCRGDGNCYYRAVGFCFLERGSQHMERFRGIMDSALGAGKNTTNVADFEPNVLLAKKKLSTALTKWLKEKNLEKFYTELLTDVDLDIALVWVVRGICAQYCLDNGQNKASGAGGGAGAASSEANGDGELTLEGLVSVLGYKSMASFVQNEVLCWGEEAADTVQIVMPQALQCQMRLVQLDRTSGGGGGGSSPPGGGGVSPSPPTVMHFPELPSAKRAQLEEQAKATTPKKDQDQNSAPPMKAMKKSSSGKKLSVSNGNKNGKITDEDIDTDPPIDVCLLFKPGHYDILYSLEVGVEVADAEKEFDLEAKCRQPWECCICMANEADDGGDEGKIIQPWWCEDRVCEACRPTLPEGEGQCPVCKATLRDSA